VPTLATPRELSDYFQYGPEQRKLLAALRPALEKHADALVAAFYRHLLSFPATRNQLRDPTVRERLIGAQREYLLSLAGPELDAAYVEHRRHIGEVHARIGVEPGWVLGAYGLYLSLLVPVVTEAVTDAERIRPTQAALERLLFLDASLAVAAYMEQHEQDLEHLNRELAAPGAGSRATSSAATRRCATPPSARARPNASRRSARWSRASPTRSARRWA
jgi:hypothetical protein